MLKKIAGVFGLWLWTQGICGQQVKLDTLTVPYVDFNGEAQQGVIICNAKISSELKEIFKALYIAKYPIERIRPIAEYGNDDERSIRPILTSKSLLPNASESIRNIS